MKRESTSISRRPAAAASFAAGLRSSVERRVPHWLQAASFGASYEYLNDVYSRRNYRLFNTALNLPLDAEGHLALQLAYQYGNIEETGGKVNLTTAGVSAKW